jgi:hypothetical protein
MAQKKNKSRKTVKTLPARKLTTKHAKGVKGGGKHIGQPKYEDISVNTGTGMAKEYYSWKR